MCYNILSLFTTTITNNMCNINVLNIFYIFVTDFKNKTKETKTKTTT